MNRMSTEFREFEEYWRLSEELIAEASKEDIVEVARILAMQTAHFARKYGALQLPDLAYLLSATHLNDQDVGLLRDGAEALVGVLGMVSGMDGINIDDSIQ